ncbi:MAG: hypothetical protein AAGF87_01370 [Bacteroidota bacterium]
MEDQNKLDKYIAGLFDENPEVPAELAWENMDFDLPDHTANSRKSRKRFLPLLLLLMVGLSSYFFWGEPTKASIQNEDAVADVVNPDVKDLAGGETERIEGRDLVEKLNSETDLQQRLNSSLDKLSEQETQRLSNGRVNYSSNASAVAASNDYDGTLTLGLANAEQATRQDWMERPRSSNVNKLSCALIEAGDLLPISIPGRDVQDLLSSAILPFLSVDEKAQKSKKAITLLLGFGVNTLQLDVEEGNILQEKVSAARGRSYKLGLSYPLSDKWHIQASLRYDRIRTLFIHSRDLEPVFDAVQGVRILREERTFHNNYTDLLGLQLGVDRIISILPNVDVTIGPVLAGNYIVNLIGKTTEGEETFPLSIDGRPNRFSMSAGLRTGIQLNLNPSTHVGILVQSRRFITRSVILNDGVSTNSLHKLIVQLGYRF